MRSIGEAVTHFMFPVVLLPGGEGRLNQCWAVLLHSMRSYCFSFADTAKLVNCSSYPLTDQGAEFGLGMTEKIR